MLVAVRGVRVPVVVRMGEGLGEEGVLVGEWWVACLFDSCGCFTDLLCSYVHGCMDRELDSGLGVESGKYQTIVLN